MSFLGEIKRRKVLGIAAAYAVVAWIVIQTIDILSVPLALPEWLSTVAILSLMVGFPIAIALSWIFGITPAGVMLSHDDREEEREAQRAAEDDQKAKVLREREREARRAAEDDQKAKALRELEREARRRAAEDDQKAKALRELEREVGRATQDNSSIAKTIRRLAAFFQSRLTKVALGAAAPSHVQPGHSFTAQFMAYTKDYEQVLKDIIDGIAPTSKKHLAVKQCRWATGTTVKVELSADNIDVENPSESFEWNGRHNIVDFDCSVPPDSPENTTTLKYDVYVDGFRLATLRIELEVVSEVAKAKTNRTFTEPATTAFGSYSSVNRSRVLDRVSAVQISAGLIVFVDVDSLRTGKMWKRQLQQAIVTRDLFLLFWSENAAESKYVDWEWRTAFKDKGVDGFQFHPLDPVDQAPPPDELSDVHFGDPLMIIRAYEEMRRANPNE